MASATRFDAALSRAVPLALRALRCEESDGWSFHSTQQGVVVHTRPQAGSAVCATMGTAMLAAPAAAVHRVLTAARFRPLWDANCTAGEEAEAVDAATRSAVSAFKAPWPVKPREVFAVRRTWRLGSGALLTVATSADGEGVEGGGDARAPREGHVRVRLDYSAVYVRALDEHSCKAVYVVAADPRGKVPKRLASAFNTASPLYLAAVRSLLDSEPAYLAQAIEEARLELPALDGRPAPADPFEEMEEEEEEEEKQLPRDDNGDDEEWVDVKDAGAVAKAVRGEVAATRGKEGGGELNDTTAEVADAGGVYEPPPSRYDALLEAAFDLAVARAQSGDGWTHVQTKEGVEIFTQPHPGSPINAVKGVGVVEAPPEVVRDFFANVKLRPQWDRTFDRGRVLREVDLQTRVTHMTTKVPWPVTQREVVYVSRTRTLPDGSTVVLSVSCDDDDAPPHPKKVLSQLIFAIQWLVPLRGGAATRATYCMAANPQGSLPAFLVNQFSTATPLAVARIAELVRTRPDLVREAEARVEARLRALAEAAASGATARAGAKRKAASPQPKPEPEPVPKHGAVAAAAAAGDGPRHERLEWGALGRMQDFESVTALGHVARGARRVFGCGSGAPPSSRHAAFETAVGAVQVRVRRAEGVGDCIRTMMCGHRGGLALHCTAAAGRAVRSTGRVSVRKGEAPDRVDWNDLVTLPLAAGEDRVVFSLFAAPDNVEDLVIGEVSVPVAGMVAAAAAAGSEALRSWYPIEGLPTGDGATLCLDVRVRVSRAARAVASVVAALGLPARAAVAPATLRKEPSKGGALPPSSAASSLPPVPSAPEAVAAVQGLFGVLQSPLFVARHAADVLRWSVPSISTAVLCLFLLGCLVPSAGAALVWIALAVAALQCDASRLLARAAGSGAVAAAREPEAAAANAAKALRSGGARDRLEVAEAHSLAARSLSAARGLGRALPPPRVLAALFGVSALASASVDARVLVSLQVLAVFGWNSPLIAPPRPKQ